MGKETKKTTMTLRPKGVPTEAHWTRARQQRRCSQLKGYVTPIQERLDILIKTSMMAFVLNMPHHLQITQLQARSLKTKVSPRRHMIGN